MKDIIVHSQVAIRNVVIKSGSRPLVCVPLMGEDNQEIKNQLQEIVAKTEETRIDIVEFRADYYKDLLNFDSLKELLNNIRKTIGDKVLLFTIRSPREGGVDRDYPKTIEEINSFIIEQELADMVDVEFASFGENCSLMELAKAHQIKIIMSNHDFEKTPAKEEIVSRLIRMQQLGADVAKIAVMPQSREDVVTLLTATVETYMKGLGTPIVSMSMGELGVQSRILGEVYGSAITFGCVGTPSAPGQLQVRELNEMLDMIHSKTV